MKRLVFFLVTLTSLAAGAAGAVVDFNGLNLLIPDGSSSGLANTQNISPAQASGTITGLRVQLNISGVGPGGAFNGDLYATLQHESGAFAVLLNRPGRPDSDPWGYGDNGLSVTLDDSSGFPDIHTYQTALGGPVVGPLTGTWASDGRIADPDLVTATSPRLALLTDFAGVEAGGNWTLFLADLELGGEARLDGWGLEFAFIPVPETSAYPLVLALAAGVFLVQSRSRRRHVP